MAFFSRLERKLEQSVGSAFARMFKGKVHPAEIARALQQDADANATEIAPGRILVPNHYIVRLGATDYDHLHEWEKQLSRSLAEICREQFADEGWSTYGAVKIEFARDNELRTGVFEIESEVDDTEPSVPLPSRQPAAAPPVALPNQTRHLGTVAPPPRPTTRPARQSPPPAPPPPPRRFEHRIVIDGPNTRLRLLEGRNVIGRGSAAQVRVTDNGVSREHAEIIVTGNVATVRDLQSTNGTSVNGRRINTAPLRHGDVVRIGRSVLVYRYEPGDGA